MQAKGRMFFNIIIGMIVIVSLGLIGYLAYYYIAQQIATKEAEEAVAIFEEQISNAIVVELAEEEEVQNTVQEPTANDNYTGTTTTKRTTKKVSYNGYSMIGTIQITKTNVKAPIVDKVTPQSIAAAVAVLYGPGLNQIGNTVLVAHNYRNGTFFSNNKKLVVGDKIYITDSDGQKIEYSVYKTYTTSDMDFSYATRDTQGKREISLSTCTTDASKRLVIWARET